MNSAIFIRFTNVLSSKMA